jgi:hypothetical protein
MKTKGNLSMMNAVSILLTILHLWKQDSICTDSNKDSMIQSYTKAECKLFMNPPGTHQDKPQEAIFDSDSFLIQVDSGASCSISNCKAHFNKLLKLIDPKDPHNIYGLTG